MTNGEGPTERQIEAALWYVRHKERLRKIGLGVFIGVDALLLGYVLVGLFLEVVRIPQRRQLEAELTQSGGVVLSAPARPADLQLGGVEVLTAGEATDLIARVRNPNADWLVTFAYTIGMGENTLRKIDGFILPGEERIFVHTARGRSGTPVFNLEEIRWQRLDKQEIPDVAIWRAEHLDFEIKEQQFLPALTEGSGDALSRVRFKITNKTAYGYVEPTFLVLLYRGSRLVGVQKVVVERFEPGQQRIVEASWFDRIGAVSNIEVVPEINILDPAVYFKP